MYADVSGGVAWYVSFDAGGVRSDSHLASAAVRLVYGGQAFTSLISNGDSTVTDNSTGLMWAQCSEGLSGAGCATGSARLMTWADALTTAKNSRLGGYSDWLLPNAKELQSIVDYSVFSPSINSVKFPNTPSNLFWTSSSRDYSTLALLVGFNSGGFAIDQRHYGYYSNP